MYFIYFMVIVMVLVMSRCSDGVNVDYTSSVLDFFNTFYLIYRTKQPQLNAAHSQFFVEICSKHDINEILTCMA